MKTFRIELDEDMERNVTIELSDDCYYEVERGDRIVFCSGWGEEKKEICTFFTKHSQLKSIIGNVTHSHMIEIDLVNGDVIKCSWNKYDNMGLFQNGELRFPVRLSCTWEEIHAAEESQRKPVPTPEDMNLYANSYMLHFPTAIRCIWGRTNEERWGALDDATFQLNQKLGKTALMTGAQLALQHIDESQKQPKAKCPFTPQREMITKLWGSEGPLKSGQGTLF